ncbi:uncharacterized protein LOC129767795 isoform X2 [Toxorhynchites rutilus septentrionalis]|nr:uncharacterized protein LOC129767795 isoform X2 [Toxorhynchites rutilus septentrionalis]XP_055624970.1 uncharacterized protein LOC129767795 isoform X2 [Toxorhynchites rutilus septentrionalis]
MTGSNELLHLRLLREELYDLDIEDIQNDLIDRRIFSQADCKEILDEPNEDHRLDLMFTILEHKLHSGRIMIVKEFLDVLKPFYGWIVERHEDDVKGGISGPISRYLSYRNNTTVPNIDELNVYRREHLWQIQKYLKQLKHGVRGQRYLFVYGGFGTGKWTLVSQACENFNIVERMGYNIFYLSLANCNEPEQILELLENLSIQMESDYKSDDITYNGRYPTNEIYLRKRRLLQLFEDRYKNCLLILSHVRDPSLIAAFDLKCKTLVITSNSEVVASVNEYERFVVKLRPGFTEDESMELFGKALRLKSDHLPPEAHEIHRTCKGNPFVIKLIARKMSEYGSAYNNVSNMHVVKIWRKLAVELTRHSIAIENMTIKSILDQLSEEEQKAFSSLVVFRDNVKIPPSVLQRYWALSVEQTEAVAAKLINKGLLDKRYCKDQQVFYVLHYVCYSFLLKENPVENYANLHQRLVESYRIAEALQNRTELDLPKFFPNDNYFHFYIANHLEQSGMHNLFPDLFLDFGFLEQKLRYTGLPNTVGDLRHYQNRIFAHVHDPELYAEALTEFLMRAEVLLSKSADACLLQLAINCTGLISTAAKIQANRYDNRVWFYDIDHNHQHQLVQVRSTPIKVRFQDPGSALVSLDNNQISLVDLSPWYSAPATVFDGNQGRVVDMQITSNVLVALDEEGTLNVWSMKNIPLDRNARQHESDGSFRRRIQCLRPHDPNDRFVSFCIVSKKRSPNAVSINMSEMFAITKNGCLHIYNGLSNFTENTRCNTRIKDTYIIKPLVDDPGRIPKMLLVTASNQGYIFNLNTTSVEYNFDEPPVVNIHYMGNALVLVGPNQIRLRTLNRDRRNRPQTERLDIIYETPAHHHNTCSAISDDYEYVILGTTQGISIFSIRDHIEVLRTNISHNILDVDIFSLDDDQYRYILISSSEESGNVINMYSLMVTANNQLVTNQYQLEGNANFLADLDNSPVSVRTIDRKRIIQELQFTTIQGREDFHKLTPLIENRALASEVKRLIQCRTGFFVGLKNGDVLRFSEWNNAEGGTKPETLLSLGRPINVLKYYEQLQALVAATENSCMIFIEGDSELEIEAEVCECYLFMDRYLVLIYENCAVEILNVQTKEIEYRLDHSLTYGASAFNEQYLIICTTNGAIRQLGIFLDDNDQLEISVLHVYGQPEDAPLRRISSCVLSAHGELLAVGYKKGAIEVYNTEERKLIATLESHKFAVASLYFSPWQDPNSPHILVSIGEQIAFWSLDYVINNPRLDSADFKRRSNRYKSRPSLTSPAIDMHRSSYGSRSSGLASPLAASPARNGTSFTFDIDEAGLQWLSKVGPSNKPQLLSCIKLIGSAEKLIINRDFNKFFTIDDEGYIYFLRLYQPDRNQLMISFESPRPPNGSSFHI